MTVKLPFNINAGIMDYNPSDKTVRPLLWTQIQEKTTQRLVEKVLFPGEQIIVPYTHLKSSKQFPNSLIYLLTFSSGEVVPFYIQEQDASSKVDTYELNKDGHKGDGFRNTLMSINDDLINIFTSIIKGDYE
ncbi:unnamed protein product [Hanseniaspora opuntiae]